MRCAPWLCLVPFALAGCGDIFGNQDAKQPGVALGTFHVSAKPTSSSCGAGALGTPDGAWEFDVELARDDGAIYWNNGASIVVGKLAPDDVTFSLESRVVVDMRDEEHPGSPCSVERGDLASGTLDSSSEPVRRFKGSMNFNFAPTVDSDCSDLVASVDAEEPLFGALPCGIAFELLAERTGGE